MPASFLSLSPELYGMVFSELTALSDILNCLSVCRRVYLEAERQLYMDLYLSDTDSLGAVTRVAESPRVARYVKTLALSSDEEDIIELSPPWPTFFQSLVNLTSLTITQPELLFHLGQMKDCPFRLTCLVVHGEITASPDGITHFESFLCTQPKLKLLRVQDGATMCPEDLASRADKFLPDLRTFSGGALLGCQLIPGRRITWAHLSEASSEDGEAEIMPILGGEELTSLVVNLVKSVALVPGAHAHLRYLRCFVDWPFQIDLVAKFEKMVNLVEIGFFLGHVVEAEFDFGADYVTPAFSALFDSLPALQSAHVVEICSGSAREGHMVEKKRGEAHHIIGEWELARWAS